MALIDVSELMVDPDFVDKMVLVTRVSKVNNLGQNVLTEAFENSFGSIQPASGQTLERLPEAMRNVNMVSFWFKGKIIATAAGKYSSLLIFKGSRFNVKTVFDWTNWGEGWSEGLCIAELPA